MLTWEEWFENERGGRNYFELYKAKDCPCLHINEAGNAMEWVFIHDQILAMKEGWA